VLWTQAEPGLNTKEGGVSCVFQAQCEVVRITCDRHRNKTPSRGIHSHCHAKDPRSLRQLLSLSLSLSLSLPRARARSPRSLSHFGLGGTQFEAWIQEGAGVAASSASCSAFVGGRPSFAVASTVRHCGEYNVYVTHRHTQRDRQR
jgi:hypothetical protein